MVSKAHQATILACREIVLGTPGKIAWQCVGESRERIERLIDDELRAMLDVLAEPQTYANVRAT